MDTATPNSCVGQTLTFESALRAGLRGGFTIVMINLAKQVFLCANGVTRISGRSKKLAFALLAACHGGNFGLISQDDEVALCHAADSQSQSQRVHDYKERRPKVSQLLRTVHYTF
jgi:hypothetical protein